MITDVAELTVRPTPACPECGGNLLRDYIKTFEEGYGGFTTLAVTCDCGEDVLTVESHDAWTREIQWVGGGSEHDDEFTGTIAVGETVRAEYVDRSGHPREVVKHPSVVRPVWE